MSEKLYRLAEVRLFCQQVFGSPIAPQTFSRWRQRMKTPANIHHVSELEAQILVKYAELRREHGYYFKDEAGNAIPMTRSLVMKELRRSLEHEEWAETIRKLIFEVGVQPKNFEVTPAKGRELPLLIKQFKGKVVSIRTLYRMFEQKLNRKFSLNRTYSPELITFLFDQI